MKLKEKPECILVLCKKYKLFDFLYIAMYCFLLCFLIKELNKYHSLHQY